MRFLRSLRQNRKESKTPKFLCRFARGREEDNQSYINPPFFEHSSELLESSNNAGSNRNTPKADRMNVTQGLV